MLFEDRLHREFAHFAAFGLILPDLKAPGKGRRVKRTERLQNPKVSQSYEEAAGGFSHRKNGRKFHHRDASKDSPCFGCPLVSITEITSKKKELLRAPVQSGIPDPAPFERKGRFADGLGPAPAKCS
jgi:hypothetical protein